MAEAATLETLKALHRDLVAIRESRADGAAFSENEAGMAAFERELEKFWDRPPKSDMSRNAIKSGEDRSFWKETIGTELTSTQAK
jgi:nuclear pore complex protein Nup205